MNRPPFSNPFRGPGEVMLLWHDDKKENWLGFEKLSTRVCLDKLRAFWTERCLRMPGTGRLRRMTVAVDDVSWTWKAPTFDCDDLGWPALCYAPRFGDCDEPPRPPPKPEACPFCGRTDPHRVGSDVPGQYHHVFMPAGGPWPE